MLALTTVLHHIVCYIFHRQSKIPDLVLVAPTLLKYLTEKDLLATFFVVGSRVIERPTILVEQYMTGHEISVHTWSHKVGPLHFESN